MDFSYDEVDHLLSRVETERDILRERIHGLEVHLIRNSLSWSHYRREYKAARDLLKQAQEHSNV